MSFQAQEDLRAFFKPLQPGDIRIIDVASRMFVLNGVEVGFDLLANLPALHVLMDQSKIGCAAAAWVASQTCVLAHWTFDKVHRFLRDLKGPLSSCGSGLRKKGRGEEGEVAEPEEEEEEEGEVAEPEEEEEGEEGEVAEPEAQEEGEDVEEELVQEAETQAMKKVSLPVEVSEEAAGSEELQSWMPGPTEEAEQGHGGEQKGPVQSSSSAGVVSVPDSLAIVSIEAGSPIPPHAGGVSGPSVSIEAGSSIPPKGGQLTLFT